jgi:uncharacterized protein
MSQGDIKCAYFDLQNQKRLKFLLDAPMVTCEAVIAESCYLLRSLSGAPEAVIQNVTPGIFQIPFQPSREAPAIGRILRKYRDRNFLICLADEFGAADILTLDRDFAVYRWGKNKSFHMLPAP